MRRRFLQPVTRQPFRATALLALGLLLSAAAWVWAHEGHEPLPTRGVQVVKDTGGQAVGIVLSREARGALDVRTAAVEQRPVEDALLAYVQLTAPWQRHAYAAARLPGRIVRLHVRPGQRVAAGQLLAEVDSLELHNLQLEIVNAAVEARLACRVYADLETSGRKGAVPEQRLLDARVRQQQSINALDVARAKWTSLGLPAADFEERVQDPAHGPLSSDGHRVRLLPVVSPIAGVIIHADLAVGKVVEPAEHLFEIVDLSTVWARIGVLEKDLHRVTVGQPVELRLAAYPGETFRSRVQATGLDLDPRTHLGTVWADLANPDGQEPRLMPGMHGQARLLLPEAARVLRAPAEAVVAAGAERYLLVEDAATARGSQYRKQNVVVGRQTPAAVEIHSDAIVPGDRVVTQGSHELAGFFVPGVLRPSPEAARGIGLRVASARPQVVEEVLEVEGTVEVPPDRRTFVSAQLSGNLAKIHAERGQAVRAGDVLAEVASLELQNLQLDLLRAHLDAELLDQSLRRFRAAPDSFPSRQLLETEGQYQAAINRLASGRQKLAAVGLTPAQIDRLVTDRQLVEALPLRAPRDGVLVNFDKFLGQMVKAEEPVFEVQDATRPWVRAYLSPREVGRVRLGQSARVYLVAEPDFVGEGTVVRNAGVVEATDQTLSVWIELARQPGPPLRHNLLARVVLTGRRPEPTLAVPRAAVVRDGSRSYVFVRQADGTFTRCQVEMGRADDRFVSIVGGLRPDESVAVQGAAELQTAHAAVR
jgi:RND family efflux transporter MFP subunit